MKNKIFISALTALALAGCWKEPEITPSTEPESAQYQLPQGTHDYDTRIVEFFEATGTAMVYKFNVSDLYYTGGKPLVLANVVKRPGLEDNTDFRRDSVANILKEDGTTIDGRGMHFVAADEDYVEKQLNIIDELCFDFYTQEQLHKFLPPTVYLADTWAYIDRMTWDGSLRNAPYIGLKPAAVGPTSLVFSLGGPQVNNLTLTQKKFAKKSMHHALLKYAADKGSIVRTDEFLGVSNYVGMSNNDGARRSRGMIYWRYTDGSYAFGSITATEPNESWYINILGGPTDWDSFVAWIVSTTEAEREAATGTVNFLHSSKDTAGLIRRKYDIMVRYMLDNYGIDLVKIGNTPV